MNQAVFIKAMVLSIAASTSFFSLAAPNAMEKSASIAPATLPKATATSTGIVIKYKSSASVSKGLSSRFAGQNAANLGFAKASAAANRRGISLLFDKPLSTGGYLLKQSVPLDASQLRDLIAEIAKDPAVEYVEPDGRRYAMGVPNDPGFISQWHFQNSVGGINLPAAWDIANGSGVRVAVVDSGSTAHPDLTPNLIGGYDFISNAWMAKDGNGRDPDPSDAGDGVSDYDAYFHCSQNAGYPSTWHGTHVAGIVGAVTNNGLGVSGVAYGAKVVPIRVLGRCGGDTSDIADAVIWAAGGAVAGVPSNPYPAKVINVSIGGEAPCSATEQDAINIARGLGATVVVSAGNENRDTAVYAPANCSGVITVAATTSSGNKAGFSNFGMNVGLAAPGEFVLSTYNAGGMVPGSPYYEFNSGTSMSVPHVAGVAALVLQQNPGFTPDQVAARLKLGSTVFPGPCVSCGAGMLNAYGALVPPTFSAGTVFRFYNLKTGVHMFTAAPEERDSILGAMPWFQYERAAYRVRPQGEAGTLPVYRFRNKNNGAYFFTINEGEKNAVLQLPYFVLEGVAWWANSPASPGVGTIPLHRFRYIPSGSHFYSYSADEVAHIQSNLSHLYVYEGIGFYVWPL